MIVVVGGPESNNSRKLAELAVQPRPAGDLVADATELRPEWFEGRELVGLTAGTSTPDPIIQDVRTWLERLPSRRRQTGLESCSKSSMNRWSGEVESSMTKSNSCIKPPSAKATR